MIWQSLAGVGDRIRLISANGDGFSSLPATSISVPPHNSGDMIFYANGNFTSTPPSLTSGFTNIGTGDARADSDFRSTRLQYKISDGTLSSLPSSGYAFIAVLRGAQGVGNFVFDETGGIVTGAIAGPSLLTPNRGVVLSAMYVTEPDLAIFSSITGDGSEVFAVDKPTNPIALYKSARNLSFSGATFNALRSTTRLSWAVEIT